MSRVPYVGLQIAASGSRVSAADIVACVVHEVSSGRLAPGGRLPPVRVLEKQLGLSKNTAAAAYDELMARGIVIGREREGVFIAAARSSFEATAIEPPPLPELSAPALPRAVRPGSLSLSEVFIDPALLPTAKLAECARSVLHRPGLASHYDAQGYPPLRSAIAARLSARGLDVTADEIVITTGSQQSLDIVARSLTRRVVAIESPGYALGKRLFESLQLEVVGLRLDPFAPIDLEQWERQLASHRPALASLITSFHNPTGYSYSSADMLAVLELCRRHQVAILEDDWGSDMLSDGEYRPMLRHYGGKNVLYINSFTKKLLPSLRLGFVVAHPKLVPALLAMKRLSTLGNPWLTEALVAEFLERGYYDGHLAMLQRELDHRYAACLDTLNALMPQDVRWTTPGGGPILWLELPRRVDLGALRAWTVARGVEIGDSDHAFVGEPHLHGFRIGYAFHSAERLRHGLAVLADGIAALSTA
jgi:DNA-binding transcriptional MocR family regulator